MYSNDLGEILLHSGRSRGGSGGGGGEEGGFKQTPSWA